MEVLLFHITNLFCVEIGKFAFFMWKNANLKQSGNFVLPLVTAGEERKNRIFHQFLFFELVLTN